MFCPCTVGQSWIFVHIVSTLLAYPLNHTWPTCYSVSAVSWQCFPYTDHIIFDDSQTTCCELDCTFIFLCCSSAAGITDMLPLGHMPLIKTQTSLIWPWFRGLLQGDTQYLRSKRPRAPWTLSNLISRCRVKTVSVIHGDGRFMIWFQSTATLAGGTFYVSHDLHLCFFH